MLADSTSSVPSPALRSPLPVPSVLRPSRTSPSKAAVAAVPAERADALGLAQLLVSRLCHDLSGAVGVTASATDLLGPGPEPEADGVALLADAGRRAAARLAFFRAAFGFDTPGRTMTVGELRALAEPALDRPRLRSAWPQAAEQADEIPAALARIVLCLALLASEALPRGGTVRIAVRRGAEGLSVEAEGTGARLTPAVLDALRATGCADLTSATVVGYFAQVLAGRASASVAADAVEGLVRFSLNPLGAAGRRPH